MSTELESRLRQDLAAAELSVPLDLERTLAAGHRAVTARRIGRGIGAAAMLAGAALLVPQLVPGRVTAVPAVDHATVTFEPQSFRSNDVAIDLDAANLELRRGDGDTMDVTAMVTLNGEAPLRDSFTLADPSATGTHRLSDQVVIGLAPENRWIDWLVEGSGSFHASQSAESLGLTAYLLLPMSTDPRWSVRGAIWQQPGGEVHNSLGERISAANLLGGAATIYVDPELDVVGVRLASGPGASAQLTPQEADQLALAGGAGASDGADLRTMISYELYLVPEEAVGDVTATRLSDAGEIEVGTLEGGRWAGRMFVWASLEHARAAEPDGLLKSIAYRDAAGEVVTVQIGR